MTSYEITVLAAGLLLLSALLNTLTLLAVTRTSKVMKILEVNTNSKMDALLSATAKSSKAEGLKQGRDESR